MASRRPAPSEFGGYSGRVRYNRRVVDGVVSIKGSNPAGVSTEIVETGYNNITVKDENYRELPMKLEKMQQMLEMISMKLLPI